MESYSVLIRTYNSAKTIQKCLDGVFSQTSQPKEVLIIDSGSSDQTMECVSPYPIRWIDLSQREEFSYSTSLNIGFGQLKSDFVLVVSSHTIMEDNNLVEKMIEAIGRHSNVIAGYAVPDCKHTNPVNCIRIDSNSFDGWNGLWNTCALIRKTYWDRRPFSKYVWAAEDQHWAREWFQSNHNLATLRFEGLGVTNQNPKIDSLWKHCAIYASIASFSYPEDYTYSKLLKHIGVCVVKRLRGSTGLRGNISFLQPLCFLLYRARLLKFKSSYHEGPPSLIRWLFADA